MRGVVSFLVVLVLSLPGILKAQDAAEPAVSDAAKVRVVLKEDVRKLLKSEKKVDQAWGAYYVGKYGFTDLAPELWDLAVIGDDEWTDPLLPSVRAGLIQIGSTADEEQFKLLLEKKWYVCALNAAIKGESGDQLLTLMRKLPYYTNIQISTCNKLVEMRNANVAKELLVRVGLQLEINVLENRRSGGRGVVMGYRDGHIRVPDGYPPIVDYSLVRSNPHEGDVLLSPGPTNIYLRRKEVAGKVMGVGGGEHKFDLVQYRLTSLYELAGWTMVRYGKPLKSESTMNVSWSTADAFDAAVASKAGEMKQAWSDLKKVLVKSELLTEKDSAALPLKVYVSIKDHRGDKSVQLPTAEELEAKLFGNNK